MAFWKMFNWNEELGRLSADNRAILQTANIIIIFILIYFSVMSFIIARHENPDIFAKSILICIAGFYSIRLAAGGLFFGYSPGELVIWILCLIIITAYVSVIRRR